MLIKIPDLQEYQHLLEAVEGAFWGLVYKRDDCWFWCGEINKQGYGIFEHHFSRRETMVIGAHRVAYFLQHRVDPKEKLVCHRCDNRRCVRGDHLFLGTQADNMRDYSEKYQAKKNARFS